MEVRSELDGHLTSPSLDGFGIDDRKIGGEDKYRSKFIHGDISRDKVEEIERLTGETSEKLINRALEISKGDIKKAMLLLFDSSVKIEI
ncbi:hypothetical protein CMI42_00890 [Candidatus Pacearchaeota archaeon]|nr:hypothetical protein [Candidatus Pacearchaeota archaeon]|tara:strand:+ start:764 stop:1030 length:267 start_codon:yes stop_codon:yes gene_type:complete